MLIFLLFLVGVLLGVVAGGALCVSYLRREIADDIGPKLKRMQLQLDNIEAELNLAVATRHAELSAALQAARTPHADIRTIDEGPQRPARPGLHGARCRHPEEVAKNRGSSNEAFILARLCTIALTGRNGPGPAAGRAGFTTPFTTTGRRSPGPGSAGDHVANRRRVPGESCSASRTACPSSPITYRRQ